MRDKIKTIEYFNDFIEQECGRIRKFVSKLENNEVKEDRIATVKIKIHDLKLGVLIARYSMGANNDLIKGEYISLLRDIPSVWQSDYYIKNLWMISLGVLLNQNDLLREIYLPLITQANIEDWLFSFLLEDNYSDKALQFSDIYNDLHILATASGSEAKDILQNYLWKWYGLHRGCGWYDSHLCSQKLYYGYWSFEAGAMAKMLGIDDAEFKDMDYYPYDLVSFNG